MCSVCGCGSRPGEEVPAADSDLPPPHPHVHHEHHAGHGRDHHGAADSERPLGAVHVPGVSRSRIIRVEQDILEENNRYAAGNRKILADNRILGLNLMSSPGSGKTTLLVRTIEDLRQDVPIAVIEGDQQTSFDAERIQATGAQSVQINTGRNCHLDAHMVGHALARLKPTPGSVIFIENVGNLVCPAAFDLGEAYKVVMLSVTEGDDKPLKYPDIFAASDLMVVTKIDLLPYVEFDLARCVAYARRIQPAIEVVQVSAKNGDGLEDWYRWIKLRRPSLLKQKTIAVPCQ